MTRKTSIKKINLYFKLKFRERLDVFTITYGVASQLQHNTYEQYWVPYELLKNNLPSGFRYRTAKKCRKFQNASAELLFCHILVIVVVLVCLRVPFSWAQERRRRNETSCELDNVHDVAWPLPELVQTKRLKDLKAGIGLFPLAAFGFNWVSLQEVGSWYGILFGSLVF